MITINHFISDTVLREYPLLAQRLHLWSRDVKQHCASVWAADADHPADMAMSRPGHTRDHFTQAEMDLILNLPGLSIRDHLMLQIMAETGLRRRAVSWLLVESVFDRESQTCLPTGKALEKGMVVRQFVLSQTTAELLKKYVMHVHPGPHTRWLFPSSKKANLYPITPSVVNNVLLRACAMAKIRGNHTHTHAVRKESLDTHSMIPWP